MAKGGVCGEREGRGSLRRRKTGGKTPKPRKKTPQDQMWAVRGQEALDSQSEKIFSDCEKNFSQSEPSASAVRIGRFAPRFSEKNLTFWRECRITKRVMSSVPPGANPASRILRAAIPKWRRTLSPPASRTRNSAPRSAKAARAPKASVRLWPRGRPPRMRSLRFQTKPLSPFAL